MLEAKIGIFGGSGFYELLEDAQELEIETRYGPPSDKIAVGKISGREVAFLPRHGKDHRFPAQSVPYKANLAAFKKLGVEQIIAPCSAGSLQAKIKPGDFVIVDQFIDRTKRRDDTFFHGPKTVHVSAVDAYCPQLGAHAHKTAQNMGIRAHKGGAVVVVEGPRFSSKAESSFYSSQGWDVINMTQYPEVILAHELEMCYCGIALATDYDAGLEGLQDIEPVSLKEGSIVFKKNIEKVKSLILAMIQNWPEQKTCECGQSLRGATF